MNGRGNAKEKMINRRDITRIGSARRGIVYKFVSALSQHQDDRWVSRHLSRVTEVMRFTPNHSGITHRFFRNQRVS